MKKKYHIITFLSIFYSLNIFAQIVNEGTFFVSTSTMVYFGDEYTNNGTHNSNGDLFLNSNFINNDSTSSNSGTTFFKSSVNNIQTISGSKNEANFYNLEIDNILTGVQVIDNFGVFVNNSVNFVNGDMRLIGEAQLIQTHSGLNANSNQSGELLRDQQGNFSVYAYNYWSSPVNNSGVFTLASGLFDGSDATVNPFTPQQVLLNPPTVNDGLPSIVDGGGNVTTALTISPKWLYTYLQGSGGETEWIKIDENSNINPGEGYTMKGTNTTEPNQNYVFKGSPNDGDYYFLINTDQFSLIGNPYPSAIDCDEFIKDNISVASGGYATTDIINASLYFWVDGGSSSHTYAGYYGGYATRNLTAGAPPSVAPILIAGLGSSEFATAPKQYMGVSQGFFVKAVGDGNITFKNSQRVFKTENSGESVHYKSGNLINSNEKSIVRLGYEDPEGFHRQIVLGFLPGSVADEGYNLAYDALMLDVREDDLFFKIENDLTKKYVIQGVGAYNESMKIPLGIRITEQGNHIIMLDGIENFEDNIYILDRLYNTTHNLSASNLKIDLSPGEYLDRYEIVFQERATLHLNELENEGFNVYYDGNNNVIIENQQVLNLTNIKIHNILGQRILEQNKNLLGNNRIIIPFNKKEGVYLVTVEAEKGSSTFKIFKR